LRSWAIGSTCHGRGATWCLHHLLVTGIVDDAQHLWELQLDLVRQEAKGIALRNLIAIGLTTGGATLLFVVFFVALPLVIIRLAGNSLLATVIWLFLDGVGGIVLALVGVRLFRVPDLKTTRSARAVLETRDWLLREIRSNG
jgi:putative superfamily III holin-X